MILYARNLSPFGRRVAVWLKLQGVEFRQIEIAPMENFEELLQKNPAGRVPVLELADGRRLVDSGMICDHLDAVAPPEKRLTPSDPALRLEVTQTMAHALGATEKGVAWVYEKLRRPQEFQWPDWEVRLLRQIAGALSALEAATPAGGLHGGAAPNAADVVSVVTHDFIGLVRPDLLGGNTPKLAALSARANALPAFAETAPKIA